MRIIAHLDLDAFYASVEELLDPALRDQPLVIGADPRAGSGRGVVATANYAARAFGIRSAMPISEAYRRCPHATYRPPRIGTYRPYSERVMALVNTVAQTTEQVSIDEVFFDCGADFTATCTTARALQARIAQEIGLSASIGIGTGKLIAKIASDLRKPRGFVTVPPGREAAFLAPLPVERMWGIGPVAAQRLQQLAVRRLGDLARLPDPVLRSLFGSRGPELGRLARGLDERPLVPQRDARQISREHTFLEDTADPTLLDQTLVDLSSRVERQMAARGVWARTAVLKLRYEDFTTQTRHISPGYPVTRATTLLDLARYLFATTMAPNRRVRLLGVGVEQLVPAGVTHQLPLLPWSAPTRDSPAHAQPHTPPKV